jgi:expansin (peptidoglycan-binding protein)
MFHREVVYRAKWGVLGWPKLFIGTCGNSGRGALAYPMNVRLRLGRIQGERGPDCPGGMCPVVVSALTMRSSTCSLLQQYAAVVGIALGVLTCSDEPTAPPPVRTPVDCGAPAVVHTGDATYYSFADGSGNCCFPATPDDLMIGAMNHTDYDASYACGACVRVSGPDSVIDIRIVDQCPECRPGDIDLSPLAFSLIADMVRGRVPITWQLIPCPVSGPIVYHFKDGSNPWWTAVQVRNHRYPILSVAYLAADSTFVEIPRTDYNYFVETNGLGPGPYTFRVTDCFGQTLIDSGIVHVEDGDVSGRTQFPSCP